MAYIAIIIITVVIRVFVFLIYGKKYPANWSLVLILFITGINVALYFFPINGKYYGTNLQLSSVIGIFSVIGIIENAIYKRSSRST